MTNRSLFIIGFLLLGSMFVLLIGNLIPSFIHVQPNLFLSYDDTKNVVVIKDGKEWKLNLSQQDTFIKLLNQGRKVSKESYTADPSLFPFTSIRITRYENPPITIEPISMVYENYIFNIPAWSSEHYIEDTSNGKLKNLLSQTYDQ